MCLTCWDIAKFHFSVFVVLLDSKFVGLPIFLKAVVSETNGNLQAALLCSLKTLPQHWADRFDASMKGVGTREKELVAAS